MWSHIEHNADIRTDTDKSPREVLLLAREHMTHALALLDTQSSSPAAATLDMALHQLNHDLSG